jgi:glucose/mannose-6-phosphate isomerase
LSRETLKESIFVASSYSGNTEETLDAAEIAYYHGLNVAIITTGGKLLKFAIEKGLPYIQMPNDEIQPRVALGYSILSLIKLVKPEILSEAKDSGALVDQKSCQDLAQKISSELTGKIPVIYSSSKNRTLAYIWKITMNETAKIPAFLNVFPELNHNEMAGFDITKNTIGLLEKIHLVFLKDSEDNDKIKKRMKVCADLYRERGLGVSEIEFSDANKLKKIFESFLTAGYTALNLSNEYKTEPEKVEIIEKFKKLIS